LFLPLGEFDHAGGEAAYLSTCEGVGAPRDNCRLSTLPDGTRLRTYSVSHESDGVNTTWQVAERLVDGYIVNVNAIGEDPLSSDQVAAIAARLTPIG
jgi:hypothetical protein